MLCGGVGRKGFEAWHWLSRIISVHRLADTGMTGQRSGIEIYGQGRE
jgi:hypothetical protein